MIMFIFSLKESPQWTIGEDWLLLDWLASQTTRSNSNWSSFINKIELKKLEKKSKLEN